MVAQIVMGVSAFFDLCLYVQRARIITIVKKIIGP